MHTSPRRLTAAILGVLLVAAAAGCSSSGSTPSSGSDDSKGATSDATLTIYTGNHKDLIEGMGKAFTEQTGIGISIRDGDDADLVNQIITEGDRTKADLFVSEEPGPMGRLSSEGLLTEVPEDILDAVDPRLVPTSHDWVPYAARSRVIYYNPDLISEDELPASILDLADPEWKGKFAYAPSGAFVATVSYLISDIGEDKTLEWLKAVKENGVNEHKNGKVRDTVEAGQHAFGLSNHYYWWVLAAEKGGPDALTSKIHYFATPDAGGLVLTSGAGILKSSKHTAEAEKFLAWLVAPDGGQAIIGDADAETSGAQIPVAKGVTSKIVGVPSLADLVTPQTDQSVFADTEKATELIQQAGIN